MKGLSVLDICDRLIQVLSDFTGSINKAIVKKHVTL